MVQQDVLDYIRKTPHNSNVNVVKGMLNAEGGGGLSLPTVKYSVNAYLTSITCNTSFEDVRDCVQNGTPFLLCVFYDGDGTDAVIFPQNAIADSAEVNFEVSLNGMSFTVTHTADSITLTPVS